MLWGCFASPVRPLAFLFRAVCVCVCFCVFMEPDRAVDIDITGDRRAGGLVHAAHHPPLALPETAQGGTRVLCGTCLPRINQ